MTPTPQQSAFVTALLTTTSNLALVARAGTGKTSTILLGVAAIVREQPTAETLVCAFNKAIADEVSVKLKKAGYDWKQVQASTLHSMGFGLLKYAFKSEVDQKGRKVKDLIESLNTPIAETYAHQIEQLVKLGKQAAVGFFSDLPISSPHTWFDLADHYDVNGLDDMLEAEEVVAAAQFVYQKSLENTSLVDFDDMILMPLMRNMRVKFGKDYIFLDEAQDLSRARQALARKFLKPRIGRMIIVGDDRQAIYGFSGADAAALPNLIATLDAKVLPLNVTWRCPKAVVALAQTIVPDIEAAPEAPQGRVDYHLTAKDLLAQVEKDDAILCRNTAPLIEVAYRLIRSGKPAKVEGRAIGEGLIALAKRWKVKTTDTLIKKLEIYKDREIQKAQAKGDETKAEAVSDKVDTLFEIIKAVNEKSLTGVQDVVDFINHLFADGAVNVVTLATYHRSKGREWDNVFLYEHQARCPSRAARQDWQKLQEQNLAYVAFTRAKSRLAFVGE